MSHFLVMCLPKIYKIDLFFTESYKTYRGGDFFAPHCSRIDPTRHMHNINVIMSVMKLKFCEHALIQRLWIYGIMALYKFKYYYYY